MAFGAKAVLIVRASGNDANGGGFNPGNANFLTDLAATSATTSAPVVTSASYNFVAGDVGARVFIQSGTNWIAGWYTIASVASNAATLTASAGNATLYDGTQANKVSTATGCATTASPTGGVGGIDFSNQDAPEITYTDLVIDGTTNTDFTSAGNAVNKRLIGNYINVTSGTGFTVQRVEVVSTTGTKATCDKSLGTLSSTGGNGKMGGALASPGMAFRRDNSAPGAWAAANDVFLQSGTYTLLSSTANVSTGTVNIPVTSGDNTNLNVFEGFGTIPCDRGTAPTISAGAIGSITVVNSSVARTAIRNINVNGNSQTAVVGFTLGAGQSFLESCNVSNCTGIGIACNAAASMALKCTATGCSSASGAFSIINGAGALFCEAYSNTCRGFSVGGEVHGCLSYANSGASSDGFNGSERITNCVAYNNGQHGFNVTSTGAVLVNCIAEGHAAGYGFISGQLSVNILLLNCAGYNNNSGNVDTTTIATATTGFVTNTTGSFFTNAGSGDFSLNNTTNQGKLARGTGFPGVMPRGLSTGYADVGAIQHADPAGGSILFF